MKTAEEIFKETVFKNNPPSLPPFTEDHWDNWLKIRPEELPSILKAMEEYALQVTESKEKELSDFKALVKQMREAKDPVYGPEWAKLRDLEQQVEVKADKPDFEAMAKEWLISWDNDDKSRGQAFIAGVEKIWSDFYLPKVAELDAAKAIILDELQPRIVEMQKEIVKLKELVHEESQIGTDRFRSIIKLQSRIKELEEEIKTLKG